MFEILRTNKVEVSFVDGVIRELFLVAGPQILAVPAKPVGKYTFEVIEERIRDRRVMDACFQEPFFTHSNSVVSLLPEAMDGLSKNVLRTENAVKNILSNNPRELFIVYGDDQMLHALSAIPALRLAETLMTLMERDPNFNAAMHMVMLEKAMDALNPIMQEAALMFSNPPTDSEN